MEVDITQWWVPAVTMLVLGTYVFISGLREYRMPMPVAPAPEAKEDEGAAESTAQAAVAAPAKRGFLFRTSWIWGSVLIGAGAQAYLTYIAG